MKTPQAIYFCRDGAWICDGRQEPYRFTGDPVELIAIMVQHPELDLEPAAFYVIGRRFDECPKCGADERSGCYCDLAAGYGRVTVEGSAPGLVAVTFPRFEVAPFADLPESPATSRALARWAKS